MFYPSRNSYFFTCIRANRSTNLNEQWLVHQKVKLQKSLLEHSPPIRRNTLYIRGTIYLKKCRPVTLRLKDPCSSLQTWHTAHWFQQHIIWTIAVIWSACDSSSTCCQLWIIDDKWAPAMNLWLFEQKKGEHQGHNLIPRKISVRFAMCSSQCHSLK